MKELYHCTQSEIDEQEERILNLHFAMLQEENKREYIQQKRAEQKSKQQSSLHKQ